MSYDRDDESGYNYSDGRSSERYSTMSSMAADYETKLNNIGKKTLSIIKFCSCSILNWCYFSLKPLL